MSAWTDLLDPDEEQLREHVPHELRRDAWAELLASQPTRARPSSLARRIKSHGDYVLGLLLRRGGSARGGRRLLPGGRLRPQPRTPGHDPQDAGLSGRRTTRANIGELCEASSNEQSPGMIAYYLIDDVAERYIDLLDDIDEEIDELEEGVDTWPAEKIRRRLAELRHDLLHVRKTLAPTRDAVREVVDGRVDIEGRMLFSREVFPPGGRAAVRDDVRQAAPRGRRRRVRARPARGRSRLPAGPRSIDQNEVVEAADGDRLDPPRPDLHRRALRPELRSTCPSTTGASGTRGRGPDPGDDDRAVRLLPPQALALALSGTRTRPPVRRGPARSAQARRSPRRGGSGRRPRPRDRRRRRPRSPTRSPRARSRRRSAARACGSRPRARLRSREGTATSARTAPSCRRGARRTPRRARGTPAADPRTGPVARGGGARRGVRARSRCCRPTIAAAAATAITSGSQSLPCEARIEPVISAVSPGSGMPADSPPMSSASRT